MIILKQDIIIHFSIVYLRGLFYSYLSMMSTKLYHTIDTTSSKRSYNLRTGIVGANEKRSKKKK